MQESINQLHHSITLLFQAGLIIKIRIVPKIRNLVAIANLNRSIDIGEISQILLKSIYEPEIFPAVMYKADRNSLFDFCFWQDCLRLEISQSTNLRRP